MRVKTFVATVKENGRKLVALIQPLKGNTFQFRCMTCHKVIDGKKLKHASVASVSNGGFQVWKICHKCFSRMRIDSIGK
jgi:NAD-dependent SIR2 family protein deacetylase